MEIGKIKMIYISILCLRFILGYIFVHKARHDILFVTDCETVESPSAVMCALICERYRICLNFAFNKTEFLCKYNCRVFWSKSNTHDRLIYYEQRSHNVANNKPARGSSVWKNNSFQFPELAVDGLLSSRSWGEECFHSDFEVSPWILVDLQTITDIDYLKIYNRWDREGDRLHDIKIQIDDVDDKCDDYLGPAADSQVVFVPCLPVTRGRRVKVYIDGAQGENNILTISELEIRQFN